MTDLLDTNSKIGVLRKTVYDLTREHERAGEDALPTSARFLYYELVQRAVLKKHGGSGRRAAARPDPA